MGCGSWVPRREDVEILTLYAAGKIDEVEYDRRAALVVEAAAAERAAGDSGERTDG